MNCKDNVLVVEEGSKAVEELRVEGSSPAGGVVAGRESSILETAFFGARRVSCQRGRASKIQAPDRAVELHTGSRVEGTAAGPAVAAAGRHLGTVHIARAVHTVQGILQTLFMIIYGWL